MLQLWFDSTSTLNSGVWYFSEYLKLTSTLRFLDLAGESLNDGHISSLCDGLASNHSLEVLLLRCAPISLQFQNKDLNTPVQGTVI